MTWYRINVLVGATRQVLEIQAERARISWLGALAFEVGEPGSIMGGRTVAHFRAGQWGSFWEVGALKAEVLGSAEVIKEGERPAPLPRSRGPFEPRQKPQLP